jgi:hypothetical protein
VNKLALLAPLCLLIAGAYLFVLAMAPAETVELVPGHEIPDRLAMLLGAIAVIGAIAVGTEIFRATKRPPTGEGSRA